mmetsp:Transcript_9830/g.28533  ORF Transcript_9830/g.28533 Transcript_9830/m.28533 type:complete len:284 (-) Transcript_9830:26-877(-)
MITQFKNVSSPLRLFLHLLRSKAPKIVSRSGGPKTRRINLAIHMRMPLPDPIILSIPSSPEASLAGCVACHGSALVAGSWSPAGRLVADLMSLSSLRTEFILASSLSPSLCSKLSSIVCTTCSVSSTTLRCLCKSATSVESFLSNPLHSRQSASSRSKRAGTSAVCSAGSAGCPNVFSSGAVSTPSPSGTAAGSGGQRNFRRGGGEEESRGLSCGGLVLLATSSAASVLSLSASRVMSPLGCTAADAERSCPARHCGGSATASQLGRNASLACPSSIVWHACH